MLSIQELMPSISSIYQNYRLSGICYKNSEKDDIKIATSTVSGRFFVFNATAIAETIATTLIRVTCGML